MSRATWQAANRAYLAACIDQLRGLFAAPPAFRESQHAAVERARGQMPAPPALDNIVAAFRLSPFERHVLLLAAAPELDPGFAQAIAEAASEREPLAPTLGVAMAHLPEAHWASLTPQATLRRWGLVDLGPGALLTERPLVCPERMLHHLLGTSTLEPELAARLVTVSVTATWPESRAGAVASCRASFDVARRGWGSAERDVVLMVGRQPRALIATAAAAATELDRRLLRLRAADVPASPEARARFVTQLGLDMALRSSILLVDAFDVDVGSRLALRTLAEDFRGPLVVVARDPIDLGGVSVNQVEIGEATFAERRAAWEVVLAGVDGAELDRFASTFDLEPEVIREIGLRSVHEAEGAAVDPAGVWREARAHGRTRLMSLAQPMRATATLDDLVLPDFQRSLLDDICSQMVHRATVFERWGLSSGGERGRGIAVLLSGPSGTGKTLTAEALAHDLELDLFRIDLPQIANRSDAERSIRAIFDAAEAAGAVLLFDEADALLSRRATGRAPIDRQATLEVGFLLQQMETFRGLAVLTTNVKELLDPSLLRRLRFVVDFPFPDAGLRRRIWARVFPEGVPLSEGLDLDRLAELSLPGGNIRNIALGAAFAAAASGGTIGMEHIERAARAEYAKIGRKPGDVRLLRSDDARPDGLP